MVEGGEWYGGYAVETTRSGVTVEKGLDLEALPLPAIRYRITNGGDGRVAVRVREELPVEVPVENVGFHGNHRAEGWAPFEDGRLEYVVALPPGESVETLYCVWLSEAREVFGLLREPDLDVASIAPDRTIGGHEGDVPKRYVDDALDRGAAPDGMADDVAAALGEPSSTGDAETTPGGAPGRGRSGTPPEGGTADGQAGDATATDPTDVTPADDGEPTDDEAIPAPPSPDATTDSSAAGDGTEPTTAFDGPLRGGDAERVGAAPSPPDAATVRELDDPAADGRRFFLRGRVVDGHHGGGAVAVFQELSNALSVLGRRVEGEGRATERIDAVVATDLEAPELAGALGDRDQVAGALVAPIDAGDGAASVAGTGAEATEDATTAGIEAGPAPGAENEGDPTAGPAGAADRDGTAAGDFDDLKAEVDPVSAAELEAELEATEFPGIDTDEEPDIDELLAAGERGRTAAEDGGTDGSDDVFPDDEASSFDGGGAEVDGDASLLFDEGSDDAAAGGDGKADRSGTDTEDGGTTDARDGETADGREKASGSDPRTTSGDDVEEVPSSDDRERATSSDDGRSGTGDHGDGPASGGGVAWASDAGDAGGGSPRDEQSVDDEVATLRAELSALRDRVDELEQRLAAAEADDGTGRGEAAMERTEED